jgi:hypothetical protein
MCPPSRFLYITVKFGTARSKWIGSVIKWESNPQLAKGEVNASRRLPVRKLVFRPQSEPLMWG